MDERDDRGPKRVADDNIAAFMARLAEAGAKAAASGDPTYQTCQPVDETLRQWREACDRDFKEWQSQWRASHPDEVEGADAVMPARRKRAPTLVSVARQASRAGIEVARYEVDQDGKIAIVTGKTEIDQTNDLDKWLAKRHAH